MSLISELKRRNIFRAAITYGIVAWGIAQIADLLADNFDAPGWVMKLTLIVLLIGFPVTVIMSWLYILTPSGFLQESDSPDAQAQPITLNNRYDRFIIVGLVAVLGYFVWDKFGTDIQAEKTASANSVTQSESPGELLSQAAHQSIAVLPFVNMSDDAENEYFADGLAEELLNMLVKIPELKVAARTSSFSFKGKNTKISEIARELNVSHVLEGSVRRDGDQVRITAQLIQADNGFHLWSETYDRTFSDIFRIQDEIATEVAQNLKVTLMENGRSEVTLNPEAYALHLKGLFFLQQRGRENIARAKQSFVAALELYPDFAEAWTYLAMTYNEEIHFGVMPHDEGIQLARNAIEQAKRSNPNFGPAWGVESFIKKNAEWDWRGAQLAIDKAVELDPTNSSIMVWRASMAGTLGHLEESLKIYQQAYLTDPISLSIHSALGLAYLKLHRYPEAIETFSRQIELQEDNRWAHYNLAKTYLLMGNRNQALIEIEKNPENAFKKTGLALIHYSQGQEEDAQKALNALLSDYPEFESSKIATIFAWHGNYDEAFHWLQNAVERRESGIAYLLGEPMFYSLREDPRWAKFLEQLDLLEYWKAMPADLGGPL